jgi:hypothetical protein
VYRGLSPAVKKIPHLKFLVNKPTDAQTSNFIGIITIHVSGSLTAHHQEFWPYIRVDTIYAVLVTECYQAWDVPSRA